MTTQWKAVVVYLAVLCLVSTGIFAEQRAAKITTTAHSRTQITKFGLKGTVPGSGFDLAGSKRFYLYWDILSEGDTDTLTGDSIYITFLRHYLHNDTSDAGSFGGRNMVWDSLFTFGPYGLDTSLSIEWYATDMDTIWGLGFHGDLGLQFDFLDTATVNNGRADTLEHYIVLEEWAW